ncbi:MAG TPA: hypothetical protein VF162_17260 [Streptosporangiaceae bacterium]
MATWLVAAYIVRPILNANPAAGHMLNHAFVLSDPHAPPPTGTPVARYRSLAAFEADAQAGTIHKAFRWVLYDPESWPDTPPAEQADPCTAMQSFGQLAHSLGYRVIHTPARDLALVPNASDPRRPGENITAWYLRTEMAGCAARYADVVDIQAQALTLDQAGYASFVAAAGTQARAANPYAIQLAGVSTKYGTAGQMAAAARAVDAGGYWLNVPGPHPDFAKAAEFLKLMAS